MCDGKSANDAVRYLINHYTYCNSNHKLNGITSTVELADLVNVWVLIKKESLEDIMYCQRMLKNFDWHFEHEIITLEDTAKILRRVMDDWLSFFTGEHVKNWRDEV